MTEDFATFEQSQNDPPADPPEAVKPEAAPEREEVEEAAEEVEQPEEQEEEPKPKPKVTAQERIDEITAARRAAEREAKYWRDVAEGRTKLNGGPAPTEEPKAPNPNDFDFGETDPKYIEAVIDYRVERGLDKVRGSVAQDLHIQAAGRAWEAKQDAARSEFADYDEVVQTHDPVTGAAKWPCSAVAAEAIQTSDAGGKIAYHLASHPDEARRIAALPPIAQVREIGRIEASLTSEQPAPAKTTNAPKPPGNQARGAGGHFSPSAATEDFAEFEALATRKAR